MNKNETLIQTFYNSFAKRDHRGMQACYHKEALFSDPVFGDLTANKTKAMWHMLCESGKDLQIKYGTIAALDNRVQVEWQAWYTFRTTNRQVHNNIQARFIIQDGQIIKHDETFDLWRWSRMALGLKGTLLGWTRFLHDAVSKKALRSLDNFIQNHPEYRT